MSSLPDWMPLDRLALIALAVLWLEILTLCLLAPAPIVRLRALFANAMSGSALLLAVMLAIQGADWRSIALLLAAGGLAHAADTRQRLRRQTRGFNRRTE